MTGPGASKADQLDFAKSEFVDKHGELFLDLSSRFGDCINRADRLELSIMIAHIDYLVKHAVNRMNEAYRTQ